MANEETVYYELLVKYGYIKIHKIFSPRYNKLSEEEKGEYTQLQTSSDIAEYVKRETIKPYGEAELQRLIKLESLKAVQRTQDTVQSIKNIMLICIGVGVTSALLWLIATFI